MSSDIYCNKCIQEQTEEKGRRPHARRPGMLEGERAEMQAILRNNLDKIKTLCMNHNVRSLFAFGSVCTDEFNDSSDVDLLITFKPMDYGDYADNYFTVADKLEEILQRPVNLVTDKSISNPYFIDLLNQTKTLLYENQN